MNALKHLPQTRLATGLAFMLVLATAGAAFVLYHMRMTKRVPNNPLTEVTLQIPFDRIQPEQVNPAIDSLIKDAQSNVDVIAAATVNPTYQNTFGALDHATENLEFALSVIDLLESVATSPEFRAAYNEARPKASAFYSALSKNQALYKALKDFAGTLEAQALAPTEKRFVKKTLDDFKRNGAELDEQNRKTLEAIDVELTELTTQFSQNVLDSTNAFELIITEESDLAGLPPTAIEAAREDAKTRDLEGWRFTLQEPSMTPVLTYLDNGKIREKVWRAYQARATSQPYDNRPLIKRVLELRNKKARTLGYKDFSDLVLEDRMAGNGAQAKAFVEDLRDRTQIAFDRENAELVTRARRSRLLEGVQPWDVAYAAEKQRKELFNFDEEELRPYFPLDRVLRGLFEIVQELYGVRIAEHAMKAWDPAVQSYEIQDADGQVLAYFFVDLHPRENKRGGAWMQPLLSAAYSEKGGKPQLGLFCANLSKPVGGKPALLTHGEVETLFHEFGHLLHHSFSRVSVRSLAGTNVAWDFVELPSQIMENWCWERESLDLFAAHYQTGEKIPADLFDKMLRARTYRAANAQMRQLGFATLDLLLHREYDQSKDGEIMAYARDVVQEFSPAPLPEDYGMIAGFGHLFADPVGYGAGYYSYKWAEVLDADAFTRFKKEGVVSRAVGTAFRRSILEKGNSDEPEVLYEEFMGRGPKLDALLERAGLQ